MNSPETMKNPLKRSFESMESNSESMDVDKDQNFTPRKYQMEAFGVAMKRNTIAALETGAGKTLIAIMMIKEIGKSIKLNGEKKLIIFLAPTVHLVHQQCEFIKFHTELEVEEYYGAKGVDQWNSEKWDKEVAEHDILVMTAQILLDALRKAFLSLNTVCLMILDECHHATGNHPYTKIMKEFYHNSGTKPKIFGMTASPVIRKCVMSVKDCEGQISALESLLDSQVYTIENTVELDELIPSAKESCRFYDSSMSSNLELKTKMDCAWSKVIGHVYFSRLDNEMNKCVWEFITLDHRLVTLSLSHPQDTQFRSNAPAEEIPHRIPPLSRNFAVSKTKTSSSSLTPLSVMLKTIKSKVNRGLKTFKT